MEKPRYGDFIDPDNPNVIRMPSWVKLPIDPFSKVYDDSEEWTPPPFTEIERDRYLKKYELPRKNEKAILSSEEIQRFFDVAEERKKDIHYDTVEEGKEFVIEELSEYLFESPEFVRNLLAAIRYDKPVSLKDLEVVENLYVEALNGFMTLEVMRDKDTNEARTKAKLVIEAFKGLEVSTILNYEQESEASYLFTKRLQTFIERIQSEEVTPYDDVVPFMVTQDLLATFSEDKDRLYVVDNLRDSKRLLATLNLAKKAHDEEQIVDIHFEVLDHGTPIDKLEDTLEFGDPESVDDYLTSLQEQNRKVIEEDFGIRLSELSIREQFHFISILKKATTVEVSLFLKKFIHRFGILGAQTFLAFEELDEMQAWATLGTAAILPQGAPEEQVRKIYTAFIEMDRTALDAQKYLATNFNNRDVQKVRQVMKDVRKRALNLYSELLAEYIGTEETDKHIQKILEKNTKENALFISAFKTLKSEGELNIDEIQDTSFETISAADLPSEDKQQMLDLLRRNWEYSDTEFSEKVAKSLEESFNNRSTTFYVLRHKGQIAGFNRFDDNSNGNNPSIYFGSFNTDPRFGNGKLGEAIYEESLKREKEKGVPIFADCNPLSPITQKYVESGFIATTLEDYAGVPSFSITLDPKLNDLSTTKKWSLEEIVRSALTQNTESIKTFSVTRAEDIPFELVNNGFALTRFLKQGNRIYAVFERLAEGKNDSA